MQSLWRERDAEALIARYEAVGVGRDIALCLYIMRLLGGDRRLVLHGGGNSSVKTRVRDVTGAEIEALAIKVSGSNMARAKPSDLPALRLDGLRRLRNLTELADSDLRGAQRACLLDGSAGDPSVETLLHAFLPHKFIAHCHANAALSVTNQPDGMALSKVTFQGRAALVPYTMSGLQLAQRVAEAYAAEPEVNGLMLMHHGLVSFADDARSAYENMINLVTLAEEKIVALSKPASRPAQARRQSEFALEEAAPILRGACARALHESEAPARLVLSFRSNAKILQYLAGEELTRYATAGVATPGHVIHTKNKPLILPPAEEAQAFQQATQAALADYIAAYRAYLSRHAADGQDVSGLADARPRIALVPGLGLFAMAPSMAKANIIADIAEANVDTIMAAEAIGRYQSAAESDIFAIETWALEQSKPILSFAPLAGQVAVISGGAGAIGAATARVFSGAGAAIAVLDLDGEKAETVAEEISDNHTAAAIGLVCDVTDAESVGDAFQRIVKTFGGVDILISNASAAWQGRIGDVSDEILRQSFELNFFAHQRMAQHAVRIMQAQGSGGCLLFNTSKQAINSGANFGPYGLPKAATLFLVRQYALDYGCDGIRANAVNADRIRSGLLSDEMNAQRAAAHGVSKQDYIADNLLSLRVMAEDVAGAFLHQAVALKSTGNVTAVDGGNIAAI